MRCPSCKNETFRSWEGEVEVMGVQVLGRGSSCTKCGEVLIDGADLKQNERRAASVLAERGIRTGKEFKFVRKVAGLQANELAKLIDVRPETVSRWERDEVEIPRMAVFILSQFLEHPHVTKKKLEALSASMVRR
jgi:putative zinc finger/helix-turn-helix YgiT family protein